MDRRDDDADNQSSLEDFFGGSSEENQSTESTPAPIHHQGRDPSETVETLGGNNAPSDEGVETNESEEPDSGKEDTEEAEIIIPLSRIEDSETPRNLPPSFLLSVDYAGTEKKAIIRLYDPATKRIYFWFDNTGHRPFCYTDLPPQVAASKARGNRGFVGVESVELMDLLSDQKRTMTKVIATDPLAIGGGYGSIRDLLTADHSWEAAIRYRNCYTYDREIMSGLLYKIEEGNLVAVAPELDQQTLESFRATLDDDEDNQEIMDTYAPLFFTDVPDIRRIAIDIEVYTPVKNRIPDPNTSPYPVTAIGLSDNEDYNKCFVLRRKGHPSGTKTSDFPKDLEIVFFEDESEMLIEAFRVIDSYAIVLSFVGDAFDLNYLFHRAQRLGVNMDQYCPIRVLRDIALLRRGIHVDLYKFLKNPSIRLYALSGAYDRSNLDSISKGLLNMGKLELSDEIVNLPYYELAHYCWRDANITLRITSYEDNLLLRLIVLLMRISRLSMEDVTRLGISSWIQSLFRQVHRSNGYLIPRQSDIKESKSADAHTEAVIKDKAFKGAIVIEPVAGVHFNATVLDFASLYPTIMKRHNISYETVDCPHESCRTDPNNRVPETGHWTCKERKGMISQTIGFFRDTRVKWFKSKSKDMTLDEQTRKWYTVVEKALKVYVNASYGVTGAQHFELFCLPAAESVTAYGRDAIIRTKEKAESMGIRVLYGDTDSVFLDNPSKEQQEEIIEWSVRELGIELEAEKTYKYVALSSRKKNYIGVYYSGYVEVKGLSGKKRNTPDFAQDAFRRMLDVLSKVDSVEGFEAAKEQIRTIVYEVIDRLEGKTEPYTPDELAFRVQMTKSLKQYGKTKPQHVRAALVLQKATKQEVPSGTIVEFIKVRGDPGVLPVQLAKDASYWIDKDKYIETLRSVFEQVLDSVGIDFEELLGFTTLDEFF